MTILLFLCAYFCAFSFVLGLMPAKWESRPTLESLGMTPAAKKKKARAFSLLRAISVINKPICKGALRKRLIKDLSIARTKLIPEEFFLIKELITCVILAVSYPSVTADVMMGWLGLGLVLGCMIPEFWLRARVKKNQGDHSQGPSECDRSFGIMRECRP